MDGFTAIYFGPYEIETIYFGNVKVYESEIPIPEVTAIVNL